MSANRGPAEDYLNQYKAGLKTPAGAVTTGTGAPIGIRDTSLTVGERGPILLQDTNYIDELAHFDRERIPERVVHAKGAGAFGYFEVTSAEIKQYSAAKVFESVGKKTPIAIRFSTVGGESGSADTARDPRGFDIKFYTDDGIWDCVGNNTPIFFIRDPILFPSFIHTQKRNPATHLKDADMFWDFISLRPETTHQVMFLFGDRGTPDGYRFMNGYGSHTFKLINDNGEPVYCKFHFKTDQKIKNLDASKADALAGSDPDYSIRDLYNAIASGSFPSWTAYVQIMTFEQAEKFEFNPFDLTKIWPQSDYPLIKYGKLVLDRNPNNYFAEVEQIAFAPSNLVPGIEPSPDKMLQGRLFSYADTHRHRLGANHLQLPVNCPYRVQAKNYQRDGPMNFTDNQGGGKYLHLLQRVYRTDIGFVKFLSPNYFPNSFGGPTEDERVRKLVPPFKISGDVHRYQTNEDNFTQPAIFYNKVLDAAARQRLIDNIAGHMKNASTFIQERAVKNFAQVSTEFGAKLAEKLNLKNSANL